MSDVEDAAKQAFLDQHRAAAEDALDYRIHCYRQLVDEFNEDGVISTVIEVFYRDIDPDIEFCAEQSNQLTFLAEVLTCAIARLAKR